MTPDQKLWSRTRGDLVRAIESLGFPAEPGNAIARHLGSPKAMERMISYFANARRDGYDFDEQTNCKGGFL